MVCKFSITLGFTLCLFGCFSNPKTSPSYVIVAIDRFGAGSVSCPEYLEKSEGGFFILCNDFVRMTNAYTPSLQSPAAIASLLTGEYPINHGLRHADNVLSFNTANLAQVLLHKRYQTAFFSEGDPIKSYQGLNRGFQNFYDFSMSPDSQSLSEVFKAAINFLLTTDKPTFSMIYLSALKNLNDNDKVFDDLEDQLNTMFLKLKKTKKWHNTHILVVGLQGLLNHTENNPWPMVNLSERNIKVEAFFKPATKPRDRELSFQLDNNISLADLGHTLLNFADNGFKDKSNPANFPELTSTESFQSYLIAKKDRSVKSRPRLIESSWPDWRYGSAPVYLILDDQYRVFVDKDLRIFNTLLSRELSLNVEDQLTDERKNFYLSMATRLNSEGKDQFKDVDIQKLAMGYKIWGQKDYKYPDILDDLKSLNSDDETSEELNNWMAKLAVQHQDCETLLNLAQKTKNSKWMLASKSCLKKNIKFTKEFRSGCLRVFFKEIKTWSNQCQNDLLYNAWKLIGFEQTEAQLKIFKSYYLQNMQRDLRTQSNWKTFLSSALTYEIAIEPTDFELYYLQLSDRQKSLIDQAKPQI